MIHLLLFVYLLNFVSSQNTQNIIEISPLTTKDVNETVALSCRVKDWHSNDISWTRDKNGRPTVLSFNNQKSIRDDRFHLKFENTSSIATVTLQIDKVQGDDAGVYHCSWGDEVKDVTLQIRSPPFIYGNTSQYLNTSLNGTVTFECFGGGYPVPEVTWTRENNALLPNGTTSHPGSRLKITNVQKEHAGNYYCTVDNTVGKSAKKTFRLDVDYPPSITVPQHRVGQALKFATQLECLVESSKPVSVQWIRDNQPIQDNQYYTQTQSATNDQVTSFVLKVNIEEKKVYGTYTCVAHNNLGKNTAQIELYQTEKEVCSQNCSTSSGHSIINMLEMKLSFTGVIILMLNWQNM